jgi:protein-glutamine gamma-glutamyltransferase
MRASVDPHDQVADSPRYWRGAILDVYDGRQWSRGPHRYRPLERASRTVFRSDLRRARGPQIREEIVLEPMEMPVLPSLGRPIEIRGRFGGVLEDTLGNLRGAHASGARLRYDVLAALAPDPTPPTPETIALPAIDPRVRALAEERTRGLGGAAARAEALLAIFREGFRYSLEPGDAGTADPLARFLFETRYGHCEYFASALAVLLRAADVPSRIVNGYHGGEWNEYGGYFVVRQSDAHSWVEAWIDDAWRRLDASPPATGGLARRRTADWAAWVDAARMRWYRWVVNYGAADQVEIALSVRDSSRRLWRELGDVSIATLWRSIRDRLDARPMLATGLAAGGVLAVFVAFALVRRRGAAAGGPSGVAPGTDAYLRLVRALGRRGIRRRDSETPDDLAGRAAGMLGDEAAPVRAIVALYQEIRFSGDPEVERREGPEVERLLERLG